MSRLAELLSRHSAHLWVGSRRHFSGARLSTGRQELDRALGGGWPEGALVEILAAGPGLGCISLLLPALAALTRRGEILAWLPQDEPPYAPALLRAGIDPAHVVLLRAANLRERLWAAEHCLRSGVCSALLMEEPRRLSDPQLRRLKLAATAGNSRCFLLRADAAASLPSPAPIRLRFRGLSYRRERQLVWMKGGYPSGTMTLDLHADH